MGWAGESSCQRVCCNINKKLVTMGYDSTLLLSTTSSCSFISTKVSLDLAQVNSPSNAPLKFLGRFGVFENAQLNT